MTIHQGLSNAFVGSAPKASLPPVAGSFSRGDRFYFTDAVAGDAEGVLCVTTGSPGTWVTFGLVRSATGQVLLPDGTQALPALAFASDVDNGIWRSGADVWRLGAANAIFGTVNGVSGFQVNTAFTSAGRTQLSRRRETTNYAAVTTDCVIVMAGTSLTLTLPNLTSVPGMWLIDPQPRRRIIAHGGAERPQHQRRSLGPHGRCKLGSRAGRRRVAGLVRGRVTGR